MSLNMLSTGHYRRPAGADRVLLRDGDIPEELLAAMEKVLTVVLFRIELGGAAADCAQVRVALGEREIHAAQQRHCNGNDAHDFRHRSLL